MSVSAKNPISRAKSHSRPFWTIRGQLSRKAYFFFAALGMIAPFAAWWWLATSGVMDKVFMPSPMDVLIRVYHWYEDDDLLGDAWISIYRVTVGFLLSPVRLPPAAAYHQKAD